VTARDDILNAVRGGAPAAVELPKVPDFCSAPADLADLFTAALTRLDGKVASQLSSGIQQWLSTAFPDAHRVYSTVGEVAGTVARAEFEDWAAPADIDVTVVRTPLGVAETGSILLTEREIEVSTAAVLAEHLVVLLDPADIVENVHLAYRNPAFREAAYAVLLSGPSGSADIGGVTIHPAQGVTTLTVVLSPRQSSDQAQLNSARGTRGAVQTVRQPGRKRPRFDPGRQGRGDHTGRASASSFCTAEGFEAPSHWRRRRPLGLRTCAAIRAARSPSSPQLQPPGRAPNERHRVSDTRPGATSTATGCGLCRLLDQPLSSDMRDRATDPDSPRPQFTSPTRRAAASPNRRPQ
jgi:L-lactate dehydrogenase complex protein LldG